METKKGTLEQSVLDVWQEAADMHTEGMDGRTKEYRNHRGNLESRRTRRENKKTTVKTEQPETEHGAGERAYEIGTDRYAEYTQLITPGQLGESAQEFLYDWVWDLSDEDFDNLLEVMSDEEIIALDEGIGSWIQKKTGLGPGGKAKRAGHLQKKAKKAKAKTQAIKDIDTAKADIKKAKSDRVQHKVDKKQAKKDVKQAKKDAKVKAKGGEDEYTPGGDKPASEKPPASRDTKSDAPSAETGKTDTVATSPDKGKDAAGGDEGQGGGGGADRGGNNGDAQAVPQGAKDDDEKKKKTNGSGATAESVVPGFEYGHGQRLMSEELAHVRMWREAASAAVDPKEREELGMSPEDTAQKMKQAKKPAPMVASEAYTLSEIASEGFMSEGSKEEYQKFFNSAMKKFKIDSPADLKSDEEKKKFYDYVDKNYTGEKSEELLQAITGHGDWVNEKKIELAKEFKVNSMRQALEKVWTASAEEQEKKEAKKPKTEVHYDDEEEEETKDGKTLTGKKVAAINVEPKTKP